MSETKEGPISKNVANGGDEFGDEPSGGVLPPNEELEAALRDAIECIDARDGGAVDAGKKAPPTSGMSLDELARRKAAVDEAKLREAQAAEASAMHASLETELAASKDRVLRLQADFDNFRRRTLKEREDLLNYGHENLVKDLLTTVDNLERAIEHAQQNQDGNLEGLLQGVELVFRELLGTLAKHGVSRIEAQGRPFDPEFHEAIAQEPTDEKPANTVLKVFQTGYALRNRVLRPARVVVAKAAEKTQSE